MKKIVCLMLSIALCVSFAGCGKKEDKKPQYKAEVDVEYYAKIGQIPECADYTLGSSIEDMLNAFEALEAENEEGHSENTFFYNESVKDDYTSITTSDFEYLYKNGAEDKGVSCILSFSESYGFENGTVSIEIKEALSGYKAKEQKIGEEGLSFMPYITDCEAFTYTFGVNKVTFIFVENALSVTALYRANEWS